MAVLNPNKIAYCQIEYHRNDYDFMYLKMPLYTEADVANALADVANGVSLRKACNNHYVLRSTL